MSEYIVELDSKHSIALRLAFFEEMRGGDFVRGEIVRCRDCKYMFDWAYDCPMCKLWARKTQRVELGNYEPDDYVYPIVKPDGFCAWAVKRTGAENG